MCSPIIEFLKPIVKIALELFSIVVDVFSKSYLVEFVEYSFVEPLNDSVGLWMSSFCTSVCDIIECQLQLIIVMLRFSTILGATDSQYS